MILSRYIFVSIFFLFSGVALSSTWYVDVASFVSDGDGTSWQSPFIDLQDALSAAEPGDEVWVTQGVYYPTSSTDRTINFGLRSDVAIYGGFVGTETARDQRDYENNVTILSGNIGDPNITSDNSFNVVRAINLDVTAIMDGFLVTEGNATDPEPYERGGGMFSKAAKIEIRNCIFTENIASYGGGVYNLGSTTAYYYNCKIINNTAVHVGGGVYNFLRCNTIIDRSIIANNEAILDFAGAMYNFQSSMDIYNSLVSFNKAPSASTFYMTNHSELQFYNTNVVYNESNTYPIFNLELASDVRFYNSFFWQNNSNSVEGDMYFANPESTFASYNSLVDGINSLSDTTEQIDTWVSSEEIYEAYENIVNGIPSNTVSLGHPLFVDGGDMSYNTLALDFLGNDRIADDQIDIGMIEGKSTGTTFTKQERISEIKLYPNPMRELDSQLIVKFGTVNIEHLELYNFLGEKLCRSYPKGNNTTDQVIFELPTIGIGTYLLIITSKDKNTYAQKLIVIK